MTDTEQKYKAAFFKLYDDMEADMEATKENVKTAVIAAINGDDDFEPAEYSFCSQRCPFRTDYKRQKCPAIKSTPMYRDDKIGGEIIGYTSYFDENACRESFFNYYMENAK